MKNLIKYGFIAFVICFSSCRGDVTVTKEDTNFNTVVVDSCEYFYSPFEGLKSITHKGNCKNPIHNCR